MLTERDVRLVAATALLDERTVSRVLIDGKRPKSKATMQRLIVALTDLGHAVTAHRLEKELACM